MKANRMSLNEFLELDYKMVIEPYSDLENDEKGVVITCPDLVGIKVFGETLDEALEELIEAKVAWYDMKEELGEEVNHPEILTSPSGRLTLRLPISLHRRVIDYAESNKMSVNNTINFLVLEGLHSASLNTVLREVREVKKKVEDSPSQINISFKGEGISEYKFSRKDFGMPNFRTPNDMKFNFETANIN